MRSVGRWQSAMLGSPRAPRGTTAGHVAALYEFLSRRWNSRLWWPSYGDGDSSRAKVSIVGICESRRAAYLAAWATNTSPAPSAKQPWPLVVGLNKRKRQTCEGRMAARLAGRQAERQATSSFMAEVRVVLAANSTASALHLCALCATLGLRNF